MGRLSFLLLLAGCVTGPPPDWSAAREWRFPIVDPFDDDLVATVGTIDGHGPYVWYFDTGSTFTTIDARVMQELGLHAVAAGHVMEAGGHTDRIGVVTDGQVKQWRIGTLTVRDPTFVVTRSSGATYRGYQIAGTFGLASIRYLTLDIDRDAGWVRLALPGVIHLPDAPAPASVYTSGGELRVSAQVGGTEKEFVLDSGASLSTLYPEVAQDLGLRTDPGFHAELRALKSVIKARGAFVARTVKVGGAEASAIRFIAQPGDRNGQAAGLLGQNFLSRFHLVMDMDAGKLVLAPRRVVGATARLGRFEEVRCPGLTLDDCFAGGALELADDAGPTHPAFEYEMILRGAPSHAVEIEMELVDAAGEAIPAPFRFGMLLPAGESPFTSAVPMALRGEAEAMAGAHNVLSRAKSVRVRDVRAWPGAVEKAATWVE